MAKRKTLSKKIRFEVFKRDSFTCQYCGRSAPDVILEVDHINPVANGGDNDIMNLITSCRDCNRGKGKTELSDSETIKKKKEQLDELNERRNQLEMMLEWEQGLHNFVEDQIDAIEQFLQSTCGQGFSEYGRKWCKGLINKFGFEEVYESSKISMDRYYDSDEGSTTKAFNYIERICYSREKEKNNPYLYYINYIKKICRTNFSYVDENKLFKWLTQLIHSESDFQEIKGIVIDCANWTQLKRRIEPLLEERGIDA